MAYQPEETEYLKTIEKYKGYKKNTYQSMTLKEKIDFFDGIHTERIPLFDENGNGTLWTLWDYGEITKEFIQHPEAFCVENILDFIKMLDDDCFELTFMDDVLKVIRSIIRCRGKAAAEFFLAHLSDVPERGKGYGLCDSLRYLAVDDTAYPFLKQAVEAAGPDVQGLIRQILRGEIKGVSSPLQYARETERARFKELEAIVCPAE